MNSPALALSTYRTAARSLGAKSAGSFAAAAAAMAITSTAHASIVVYTPTDHNVASYPSAHEQIYVNFFPAPGDPISGYGYGNGTSGAMTIWTRYSGASGTDGIETLFTLPYLSANFRYYQGNFLSENADGYSLPSNLARGAVIDATTFASHAADRGYINPTFGWDAAHTPTPQWAVAWSNQTGYVGVQLFKENNAVYYGWIKLTANADASQITVSAFAYNDVAGGGITAGEGLAAVPEPAVSATLLALGAAGLVAYRRRKNLRRAT